MLGRRCGGALPNLCLSDGKTWPFVLAFGRQNRTTKACSGSVAFFFAAAQLFAVAAVVWGGNADYRGARFQAANGAHEPEQAEAILNEWKAASPDDPEYYIAAANSVLNQESSVSISTKKAGPGDFVVADQKTGREVGSSSTSPPSTAAYQQAIGLLKEALSKAPARIDITSAWPRCIRIRAVRRTREGIVGDGRLRESHPGTLLYKDGKPYPEPARENLSHAISNLRGAASRQEPGKATRPSRAWRNWL